MHVGASGIRGLSSDFVRPVSVLCDDVDVVPIVVDGMSSYYSSDALYKQGIPSCELVCYFLTSVTTMWIIRASIKITIFSDAKN